MGNLLEGILELSACSLSSLEESYLGKNRVNNQGEAFETLIQDVFSGALNASRSHDKLNLYQSSFSYLGNQNNPPDIILRQGDAIEVKKIQSNSAIALNSSFPKNKLHANDTRITQACRESDGGEWEEKDIIYVIGKMDKDSRRLDYIWMVYGDCYAASPESYLRISKSISKGIMQMPGIEFLETNELAKVNKVDPLGITDLRVRGMWHIKNPKVVFEELFNEYPSEKTTVVVLMRKEKYLGFGDRLVQQVESCDRILKYEVKIRNPDNPAILMDAILLNFFLQNT